jgi:hypothetical protein
MNEMRILKTLLLLLFSTLSLQLLAHEHSDKNENITPYNDAIEATRSFKIQYLKKEAVWQNFIAQHSDWGARFNRYTKLPHRAFGTPFAYGSAGQDLVAKSLNFINDEFGEYGIPTDNLISTRNFNDGKYINVDFKQIHQGMEILWSNVIVRYSQNEEIVLFGFDAHRNVPQNLPVVLSANQAKQKAEDHLVTPIINSTVSAEKKIIPVPVEGNYEYHVVYEVTTNTQDTKEMPGIYLSYVDAETGKVWYRDNEVKQIGFNVNAYLYPTNLYNPSQILELQYLRIESNNNTYYTDVNGMATIPGTTFGGTMHLDGRYCDIVTTQNGTVSPSISPSGIVNNGSYTFPTNSPQPLIQHFTAYHHVNVVHDFMKEKIPLFTAMDNPLTTRIDRTDGSCNAFYNGTSINFYETVNGCNALSLVNTVIYHEYGHGISRQFYNSQGSNFSNGGMGEGYSDIWAFFINNGPIIGQGFSSSNTNIRRYDINPKVYPQDLVGQVHADGEIIAGAWWDTYQDWGSLDSVSALFGQSHYGLANGPNGTEGEVYFDILIDALQYDDTDNNIGNGTPHFNSIVKGFAAHGIYLLNNTEILHSAVGYTNSGSSINMQAEVLSDFSPFVGDLNMVYRPRTGGATTNVLMNKNNLLYDVIFPSQTAGDVYEYIFELSDNTNSYTVPSPKNADFGIQFFQRNLPYYLMIGYTPVYKELFDDIAQPTGWTIGNAPGDAAIRGVWEHGAPVPSFQDPNDSATIVQTYRDANMGGRCLVTANASNPNASIGTADVDAGKTTVISPVIDISSYNTPFLSYSRWFSNSQGTNPREDEWRVEITYNGGSSWNFIDRTFEPDVSWRWQVVPLFKSNGSQIQVRFIAEDDPQAGNGGSLVEAAMDAFVILDLGETPTSTTDIDKLRFQIFPNPASKSVNVLLPSSKEASVEILSSIGSVLDINKFNGQKQVEVSTSNLASGLYYVRVYQAGKMNIQKLTITK